MATRNHLLAVLIGLSVFMAASNSSVVCRAADDGQSVLVERIRQSERILIVSPEKDVDLPGGEQFLVEIKQVLRGSGEKGKLARIVQSGDEDGHPKFAANRSYLFLLNPNANGKGWVLQNDQAYVVEGDKLLIAAGDDTGSVSLDDVRTLIADNPVMPEAKAAGKAASRTNMAGKWFVTLNQNGTDLFLWLVEISETKGAWQVKLLATSKIINASTLDGSVVTEQDGQFVLKANGQDFVVQIHLEDGSGWGNVMVGGMHLAPARLIATEATNFRKQKEAEPSEGRSEFVDLTNESKPFDAWRQFVEQFPASPLVFDAARSALQLVQPDEPGQEKFREFGELYLKSIARWGDKLVIKAQVDLAAGLADQEVYPELGLVYAKAAAARFDARTPPAWKQSLEFANARLSILKGDDAAGLAALRKLHEENPFNIDVTWFLARHADKANQTDEALALYAEIVALPMAERMVAQKLMAGKKKRPDRSLLPSGALNRLWHEKHGDNANEELEKYLDETQSRKLHALAHDRVEPRKAGAGTRVVLCELFTGSECPPCVAADLATESLEMTYQQSELIVLRYHQHIPAPDPLANSVSQDRFEYYQGRGTPTLVLNGQTLQGAGGFLDQVRGLIQETREQIDPVLKEQIDLTLKLSARNKNGKIEVSATAGGLPEFPDQVRLRLVLAEDRIAFVAGNGIRFHEMVVRAMPGTAAGIEPKAGKLAFQGEVDLAELKRNLTKYLAEIETQGATEFSRKPLDMQAMHLIAFLQDDKTQDVLQAASIPVAGLAPPAAE